jgi:hypothetical protein
MDLLPSDPGVRALHVCASDGGIPLQTTPLTARLTQIGAVRLGLSQIPERELWRVSGLDASEVSARMRSQTWLRLTSNSTRSN